MNTIENNKTTTATVLPKIEFYVLIHKAGHHTAAL